VSIAVQVAGERIGSSVTGMLAVQVAGAAIGNMICINNILSAKAVMNMAHVPGGSTRWWDVFVWSCAQRL
jgi:L-lactate permease